jgi:hypothetical protein
LKKRIGHKLELLQSRSVEIIEKRKISFRFLDKIEHPLHCAIRKILHGYAEGDRYSNINLLVGGRQQSDPIAMWHSSVDMYIFEHLISERRKLEIRKNANIIDAMMSGSGIISHTAETGETISSFADGSFRAGMFKAVAPYRQLYVLQIIRYWVELLWELGSKAQALGRNEIPFFGEIFGGFYNNDAFFKSRKVWVF